MTSSSTPLEIYPELLKLKKNIGYDTACPEFRPKCNRKCMADWGYRTMSGIENGVDLIEAVISIWASMLLPYTHKAYRLCLCKLCPTKY